MIIEGAFMKIPEVLNYYGNDHYLYESSITHLFSNSLMLELNARNIDNPLNKVFFEKRYDFEINRRCDIFTNFDFLSENLYNYGYYRENYIEVKYFGNQDRKKGNTTKSKNAGSIIYDIFRLKSGTEGLKNIGLYSLVVFDSEPKNYLAFSRDNKNEREREWLQSLVISGENTLYFDLSKEPETIKKLFEDDLSTNENLILNYKLKVSSFKPIEGINGYFGFLIQIL